MTLQTWERLGPGRYATQVNGHSLQIIRNPDFADPRRYVPVVNRVPLDKPCSNLSQAKTSAIRRAQQLASERGGKSDTAAQDQAVDSALRWEPSDIRPALEPVLEMPRVAPDPSAASPAPEPEAGDPLGLEYAIFEEVPPPAAPETAERLRLPPPEEEAGEGLRISLSGIALTEDQASSIAAIRAAVELLREVPGAKEVRCRVYLPNPWIDV